MKTASEPNPLISPDDFRRLGVRLDETRIAVIRLAATRSSQPLAAQHLRTADTRVELQLCQIATSAYRLMDPRQRADDGSRSRIGRILPAALRSAGANRGGGFCHVELGSELAFDQDQQSAFEWSGTAVFQDSQPRLELEQRWESSVGSDPCLALPAKAEHRYLRVLAAGAMGLVLIAWLIYQSLKSEDINQLSVGSGNVIVLAEDEQFLPVVPSLEFLTASAVNEIQPLAREELFARWTVDLAPIAPMRSIVEHAEMPIGNSQTRGFQRPTGEEIVRARRSFKIRFPDLRKSVSPEQVSRQIRLLHTAHKQMEPGSIDDWTCQLLIAELSWLVNDPNSVRRQLKQTADRFEVSIDSLVADSFEVACGLTGLPETQQQLIEYGMPVADRLLISESFSASRQVVESLMPLAKSLEHDRALSQLPQFLLAIDRAERLSAVAARVQFDGLRPLVGEDQDAGVGSEIGSLGRYYCLYLRKWDLGLPYLTKAADPRLASTARRQIELGKSEQNAEIVEVASLWLALADRAEGRIADSIRLHALKMLQSLLRHLNGIEKIDLQREIEEQASQLPAYLRRSLVTS